MRINKKQQRNLIASKLNSSGAAYDKSTCSYYVDNIDVLDNFAVKIVIFVGKDSITARFDLRESSISFQSKIPCLLEYRGLDYVETYDYYYKPNVSTYMVYRKKCNPNNWYHLDSFLMKVNECIEDVKFTLLQVAQ
jgi:hypothetical protein